LILFKTCFEVASSEVAEPLVLLESLTLNLGKSLRVIFGAAKKGVIVYWTLRVILRFGERKEKTAWNRKPAKRNHTR
jgi:hypothetical protein